MTSGPKKVPKQGVKAIPVRRSSGNVFEDIGVPRSCEALAKAEIASRIAAAIEKRGLSQAAAAKLR